MLTLAHLTIAFFCVAIAQWLARRRQRSARAWMWTAALVGPVALGILACLPERTYGVSKGPRV